MNIEALPVAPVILSAASVGGLVLADQMQFRPGRYLCKPLAALAFLWLALALGAMDSSYGRWLLVGLLLCMLGDLLLMPEDERCFLAGLVAFLCGHLLYAVAFLQLGASPIGPVVSALPCLLLLVLTYRWILPRVDPPMKGPVACYMWVITGMLLCASLTLRHPASLLIIAGAWGFALSDLAVARQQFIKASPRNGLWGTPLYFFSQMVLAASLAMVQPG
ncbi:MAG: lysoplasmalogenase [Pseudomonadales bacterium]|nr:lysoplasmalogenase [Pseudomonadales bacterium]